MINFQTMIEQKSYQLADCVVEAQPLWEYPNKALGATKKVFHIDFLKSSADDASENLSIET